MSGLSFYKKKKSISTALIKEILIWVFDIAVILLIAFSLVHFMGEKTSIIGESMTPMLENGDVVIINKFIYKISSPDRFDIVVFKPNGNEKLHYYIKRVIALPGETIQILDGYVYVNGERILDINQEQIADPGIAEEPIKLAEDEYFVLGDNRNNSEDSRYAEIGTIKADYIKGKAWFRIGPKNKIGFISSDRQAIANLSRSRKKEAGTA